MFNVTHDCGLVVWTVILLLMAVDWVYELIIIEKYSIISIDKHTCIWLYEYMSFLTDTYVIVQVFCVNLMDSQKHAHIM